MARTITESDLDAARTVLLAQQQVLRGRIETLELMVGQLTASIVELRQVVQQMADDDVNWEPFLRGPRYKTVADPRDFD